MRVSPSTTVWLTDAFLILTAHQWKNVTGIVDVRLLLHRHYFTEEWIHCPCWRTIRQNTKSPLPYQSVFSWLLFCLLFINFDVMGQTILTVKSQDRRNKEKSSVSVRFWGNTKAVRAGEEKSGKLIGFLTCQSNPGPPLRASWLLAFFLQFVMRVSLHFDLIRPIGMASNKNQSSGWSKWAPGQPRNKLTGWDQNSQD